MISGLNHINHINNVNHIEQGRIQNFQSLLKQPDSSFLYIHKTKVAKEHYNELDLPTKDKGNIIRYRHERI